MKPSPPASKGAAKPAPVGAAKPATPTSPVDESVKLAHIALLATLFFYSAFYAAQQPLMLWVVKSARGGSEAGYLKLQSLSAGLQVVGSLATGYASDRFRSPRLVLVISLLASAALYGLTASSTSFTGLLLAQGATMFQHLSLGTRAYFACDANPAMLTRLLSYMGVAYTAGTLVGPLVGGWIASTVSLPAVGWAACFGSLLNAAMVAVLLPEARRVEEPKPASPGEVAPPTPRSTSVFADLLRLPSSLRSVLAAKTAFSLGGALIASSITLRAAALGLDASGAANLSSFTAGVSTLMQAFGVAPIVARVSEAGLLVGAGGTLAAAYLLYAMLSTVEALYLFALLSTPAAALYGVLATAAVSRGSPAHLVGTVAAVDQALGWGTRLASPLVVSLFLGSATSSGSVGLLAASAVGLAVLLNAGGAQARAHEE